MAPTTSPNSPNEAGIPISARKASAVPEFNFP